MTKIIGITGRSGAGKGLCCEIFEKHGIPTIDTDAVYREILSQKGECSNELVRAFGKEILAADGTVERKKLAACVFGKENTPSLLHSLNSITHKYIMAKTWAKVQVLRECGARAVLIDAPQLFEAGVEKDCDLTIGVIATDALCIARIIARDGISEQDAMRRLAAQHSNDYFYKHCTAVIENTGTVTALEAQICQILTDFGV